MRPMVVFSCCTISADGSDIELCDKCLKKLETNQVRQNLTYPLSIYLVNDDEEPTMSQADTTAEDAMYNEMTEIIDQNLPPNLRADYLKMLHGISVTPIARDKIQKCVGSILKKYDLVDEQNLPNMEGENG